MCVFINKKILKTEIQFSYDLLIIYVTTLLSDVSKIRRCVRVSLDNTDHSNNNTRE